MRCPKCGREVAEGAPICPGCDFILDTSFLSGVLDNPTTGFALPSRTNPAALALRGAAAQSQLPGDALILGNLEEEFDSFLSDATGTFVVPDGPGGGASHTIVPANVYVDKRTLALLKPDAVLALKPGAPSSLSGVERAVARLLNGKRPVARVWKKSALSKADLSVALAMLVDKGLIHLVGNLETGEDGEVVFADDDDGDGGDVFVPDEGQDEVLVDAGPDLDDATEFGLDLPGFQNAELASDDANLTPDDLAALAVLEARDSDQSGPSPWEDRTAPTPSLKAIAARPPPPQPAPSPPVEEPREPTRSKPYPRGIGMAETTGKHAIPPPDQDAPPLARETTGLRGGAPPIVVVPPPAAAPIIVPVPAPLPRGVVGLPGGMRSASPPAAPLPPTPPPLPAAMRYVPPPAPAKAAPPPAPAGKAAPPAAAPRPRRPVEDNPPPVRRPSVDPPPGVARPFARGGAVQPATKLKAQELYELAVKDQADGNLARGHMYAKMAAEQDPSDARVQELLASWGKSTDGAKKGREPEEMKLFAQAQKFEERGDYKKALELLEQALKLAPQSASLHNYFGVMLATRAKEYDRATKHLMEACDLDPKNNAYKNNLGKVVARGSTTTKKEEGGGLLALLRRKLF